ncbi:MAG: hypothetical protein Kapaf2KO_19790 [Candidatus Kapaibacteriales bacterium]
MKSLKYILIAAITFISGTILAGEITMKTTMTCGSCESAIDSKLKASEGIDEYKIDLAANTVMVKFDDSKTDEASVKKTISDLGFLAKEQGEAKTADGGKKECGTKSCCTKKAK